MAATAIAMSANADAPRRFPTAGTTDDLQPRPDLPTLTPCRHSKNKGPRLLRRSLASLAELLLYQGVALHLEEWQLDNESAPARTAGFRNTRPEWLH